MRLRSSVIAAVAALLVVGAPAAVAVVTDSTAVATPASVTAPSLARALDGASPTDRLTVLVHASDAAAASRAATAAGLTVVTTLESIGVAVAAGPASAARAVTSVPGVTYVEADEPLAFSLDTALEATRADEALSEPLTVTQTITSTDRRCRKANKPRAGCTTTISTNQGPFDGAGRTIAVVDSGIDGTHPMFARPDGSSRVVRNLKVACHDLVCADLGLPLPADAMFVDMTDAGNDTDSPSAGGHGTHVAGIAAGGKVTALGRTFSGVAPGASIVGISTGAGISVVGADTALDWIARHHADPCGDGSCPPITVVNNSYGPIGGGDFDPDGATARLQRLLVGKGVVVVWANGNDGGTGAVNVSNPAGQDPTPGVISVANYNDLDRGERDGLLAPTSSRGERGRVETYPDLSAPGTNITSACREQLTICDPSPEDPDYGTISGTSMAAPHVAGAVAVLQQAMEAAGQDPTPAAIEDVLEDTARQFAFAAPYEPDTAGGNTDHTTSLDKGHGLLDLRAAVERVFGVERPKPPVTRDCPPGPLALTDAAGDHGFAGSPATDDPALDVLSASLTGDPATSTTTLTVRVSDLPPPEQSRGELYQVSFWEGAYGHTVEFGRVVGGGQVIDYITSIDGTEVDRAVFDHEADTITVTAPATAFRPRLEGPMVLEGLAVDSLAATAVAAGLYADDAAAPCPGTVDTGASAPADPDPSEAEYAVDRGMPVSWTGNPPFDTNVVAVGDPVGDTQCNLPDDPRCDHTTLAVRLGGARFGVLRIEVTFSEDDDFDVYLYGPDGSVVTSAASSDIPEVIEVTIYAPGVYRLAVASYASADTEYQATASLT